MSRYKVISLDMFQTLVNIEGRREYVWRPILKQDYSEERALELGSLLLRSYYETAAEVRETGSFWTSKEIYSHGFQRVFGQHKVDFDYMQAVDILFAQHRLSALYDDTERFLEQVCREYEVCIVSDTDILMLPEFYLNYPVTLFTSEQYQSYKNDSRNLMFNAVLTHYGTAPEQIIHIGDTPSDILGAARAGMTSCWINRTGASWKHTVKPDYTVVSLEECYGLL
ncbi:HAD family hydrolase [Paenibacillus camerounensis]|uniref:HAD family hydrolase n=1 Tax=Paenibacillus camerounensis TaxID=1243663 RepID=UPI0005AAD80C|nr:HAD family hydrolase [Paenibacillus camerounensis]